MFCVYFLEDSTGRLYVGQTAHIVHRLRTHRKRKVPSTAQFTDIQVRHIYTVPTRYEALKLELFFQRLQRSGKLYELWQILADVPVMIQQLLDVACAAPDTEFQLKFKGAQA